MEILLSPCGRRCSAKEPDEEVGRAYRIRSWRYLASLCATFIRRLRRHLLPQEGEGRSSWRRTDAWGRRWRDWTVAHRRSTVVSGGRPLPAPSAATLRVFMDDIKERSGTKAHALDLRSTSEGACGVRGRSASLTGYRGPLHYASHGPLPASRVRSWVARVRSVVSAPQRKRAHRPNRAYHGPATQEAASVADDRFIPTFITREIIEGAARSPGRIFPAVGQRLGARPAHRPAVLAGDGPHDLRSCRSRWSGSAGTPCGARSGSPGGSTSNNSPERETREHPSPGPQGRSRDRRGAGAGGLRAGARRPRGHQDQPVRRGRRRRSHPAGVGIVWTPPGTGAVVEYPIYTQTYTYTSSANVGSANDESFSFQDKRTG